MLREVELRQDLSWESSPGFSDLWQATRMVCLPFHSQRFPVSSLVATGGAAPLLSLPVRPPYLFTLISLLLVSLLHSPRGVSDTLLAVTRVFLSIVAVPSSASAAELPVSTLFAPP